MKTFFTCLRKPSENDEALLNKINTFLSDTKNTPSQKLDELRTLSREVGSNHNKEIFYTSLVGALMGLSSQAADLVDRNYCNEILDNAFPDNASSTIDITEQQKKLKLKQVITSAKSNINTIKFRDNNLCQKANKLFEANYDLANITIPELFLIYSLSNCKNFKSSQLPLSKLIHDYNEALISTILNGMYDIHTADGAQVVGILRFNVNDQILEQSIQGSPASQVAPIPQQSTNQPSLTSREQVHSSELVFSPPLLEPELQNTLSLLRPEGSIQPIETKDTLTTSSVIR